MTDEQAALAWLAVAIDPNWPDVVCAQHRATIKAMLARPKLPEEPTPAMLHAMWQAAYGEPGGTPAAAAYRALRAELMKPPTKIIETWIVEWADGTRPCIAGPFLKLDEAEIAARVLRDAGRIGIRVTGPHKQEVSA